MFVAVHAVAMVAGVAGTLMATGAAAQSPGTVYRCPGKSTTADGRRIDEYTNNLSPAQARDQGCRTIEGAPITVIQTTPRPQSGPSSGTGTAAGGASGGQGARVPSAEQRARDDDRRGILQSELRSTQQRLDALRQEYNHGEPERRGDERNYAKYQERVANLKASIERHESDLASIKRELDKLP